MVSLFLDKLDSLGSSSILKILRASPSSFIKDGLVLKKYHKFSVGMLEYDICCGGTKHMRAHG